jgi:hypothetical protein
MLNFCCRDEGVQNFLNNKALDYERRNLARTYLIVDEEKFNSNELSILAYYTLSIKALVFSENLSKRKRKEIDAFSKESMATGAILIGQLGKDFNIGGVITGQEIMRFVIDAVYCAFDIAACRISYLECQPIVKLMEFYKSCGFVYLQDNKNGLSQMVRFL